MAISMPNLFLNAFPGVKFDARRFDTRFLDRMATGGVLLAEAFGVDAPFLAANSASDTVRGWGAFATRHSATSLEHQLDLLRRFAGDDHFAVREWAWLAARPGIVAAPDRALRALAPFASCQSFRLRRFASEATRPRSVWGKHIVALKQEPWLAEDLLNRLAPGIEEYVQDSVANWLNDVVRLHPEWVESLCRRWSAELDQSVARLVRRAKRSLPCGNG